MSAGTWAALAALAAVVVSCVALFFTARAANAAREQTKIQRQLRQDVAQPNVWVDIRQSDDAGGFLILVVGNTGPTVATDVKVSFAPPLTPGEKGIRLHEQAVRQLAQGIASLPPGRTMSWVFGVSHEILEHPDVSHQVVIEASGPFGPLKPFSYIIDLEDLRRSRAVPPGTLHEISKSIRELKDHLKRD
jgi:hypothetical protein